MILAYVLTVVAGLCAVALIGFEDIHRRVSGYVKELDKEEAQELPTEQAKANTACPGC